MGRPAIPTFKPEHIKALLLLCPPNRLWGARDRAIILTLLHTGIRRGELCSLRLEDVDFNREEIKVTGKGDKARRVYLSPEAQKAILGYLRLRRDNCPMLFASLDGRPLSGNAVQCLLAISLGLVDVEEHLRPDADEFILFERDALGSLDDVIRAALARNRPVLVKDFEIRLLERPEFDLLGFFAEKLESHVQRLRDTADRRTYPGRKEAIQSVSAFDTRLLKEILAENCSHELSIEELRVRLEKLTV